MSNTINNFTGLFAPNYWTNQTDNNAGSYQFTDNNNAKLTIVTNNTSETPIYPGVNVGLSILINATNGASMSFNWDYTSSDTNGPGLDPFGYYLNDNINPPSTTAITNSSGSNQQNGSKTITFEAGKQYLLVLFMSTTRYSGSATTVISNFQVTFDPVTPPIQISNMTICHNGEVNIDFSGSDAYNTYRWTNSNTNIGGLSSSGTGDINTTITNTTGLTQTCSITYYAQNSYGINSSSKNFTITVYPSELFLEQLADRCVFPGQQVTINFSGTDGSTYNWTNNNTSIGLSASGTGTISFTATNIENTSSESTIQYYSSISSCDLTSTTKSFKIKLSPEPVITTVNNISVTSGTNVSFNFTGSNCSSYNYYVSKDNVIISDPILITSNTFNLTGSNTGYNFTNTTNSNVTYVVGYYGTNAYECSSDPKTFDIIVKPQPSVEPLPTVNFIAGQTSQLVVNGNGDQFNVTADDPAVTITPTVEKNKFNISSSTTVSTSLNVSASNVDNYPLPDNTTTSETEYTTVSAGAKPNKVCEKLLDAILDDWGCNTGKYKESEECY